MAPLEVTVLVMVDIYSGGSSLLPDGWNAPRTAARTRTKNEGGGAELGASSSSSSPALPADIRREILSFAGTRAVVATDESLRRPLRVARWAAPRAGAPTALVVHDVLGRLEDVGISLPCARRLRAHAVRRGDLSSP